MAQKKSGLSDSELNNVLKTFDYVEFSKGLNASTYNGYLGQSYLTPDSVNSAMKNVNMNPHMDSPENIENMLMSPQTNETLLRNISMGLELQNILYKRLIQFNSNLMAYNLDWECINVVEDSEYKTKAFKNDLRILKEFLYKFDYKSEFSQCVRQMLRQGAIAVSFRDDLDGYVLQELPLDNIELIGRDGYGLLYAFNLNYFIQNNGVDIGLYKNVFTRMFNKLQDNLSEGYKPAVKNSTFYYWSNCSREDGFWFFKISPEIATLVPYYSSIFPEMSTQPLVRKLQQNKDVIAASKLLIGTTPLIKETKSGSVANQYALDSKELGKFMGLVRKGLAKEVGFAFLPSDDTYVVDFNVQDKNIYSDQTTQLANATASMSSAIIQQDKLNIFESKVAHDIDANFVKSLYIQFNKFMEYCINKRTSKYKFKVSFKDVNTFFDREARLKQWESFANKGIVRWDLAARALDEDLTTFKNKWAFSKSLGMEKYLSSLVNIYTQTGGATNPNGKSGRPTVDNPTNDSTAASQERGSNEVAEG